MGSQRAGDHDRHRGGAEGGARDASPARQSPPRQPAPPPLVNGRFEIKHKVGSGSYSDVYLGHDRVTGDKVAVKCEWTKAEKGARLKHEASMYACMGPDDGAPNFPRIIWWGSEEEYNIMVMELLGPSLEDLFTSCGKQFSLKTVLMLALQMIDRVEFAHKHGILHRDIKPNNFLMGIGEHSHRVYIMDFGLAKSYLDGETGEHIPCNKKKGITGTVRYTTINIHMGLEPSRRDDLGAIGYVLMYFSRGRLPWQGINAKSKKTKQRKIGSRKEQVSHEDLCRGYPHEFVKWLEHCDSVPYAQPPDYEYLRGLMKAVFAREAFEMDYKYDWMCNGSGPRPRPLAGGQDLKRARSGEAAGRDREGGQRSQGSKRPRAGSGRAARREEEEEDEYEYVTDEYEEEPEEEEEEDGSEEEEEESEEDYEDALSRAGEQPPAGSPGHCR